MHDANEWNIEVLPAEATTGTGSAANILPQGLEYSMPVSTDRMYPEHQPE